MLKTSVNVKYQSGDSASEMASAFKPENGPRSLQDSYDIASKQFDKKNEIVLAQTSDVQAEQFMRQVLLFEATLAISEIKEQLTALTAVSTAAPDTTVKNTCLSKLPPIQPLKLQWQLRWMGDIQTSIGSCCT